MGYTKAPVQDTHNVVRISAAGEAFLTSNTTNEVIPITCNYVECFPLTQKQWNGEPKHGVHKRQAWQSNSVSTGSVTTLGVLGRTLVMAPDVSTYPNVFFAKHSAYYMYNYSTNTITSPTTSGIAAQAAAASGTTATDSTNAKRIAFLDPSSELKTMLQDGTSVTTTSLVAIGADGRFGLVFLNSYLFAISGTNNSIYNSTVGGNLTTWNSTNFIAAEQYADPLVWIDKHKNFLVAFGTQSTEFFYDGAIEVGSPLVRQESYARQIGLYTTGAAAGKYTAKIDDDLYFLGVRGGDNVNLYRIRNFQIEEIGNQWVSGILNTVYSEPKVDVAGGIETFIVNNNSMIMINIKDDLYNLMYFPAEDTWWMMSTVSGCPDVSLRLGTQFFSVNRGYPIFLKQDATSSAGVSYVIPDYDENSIFQSYFYTPVTDFGVNYWKHYARVDAIGDFGNNDVSLAINFSPVYGSLSGWTGVGTSKNQYSNGDGSNLSWYNLGAARRAAFLVTMNGVGPGMCEALEVEYNAGAA